MMAEAAPQERAGGFDDGSVQRIDRLMYPIRQTCRWLTLVMLVVMVSLPFLQIVMREVVRWPLIGADELARLLLISMVFTALPHMIYSASSIRLEELIMMLPRRALRLVRFAIILIAAGVFLIAAVSTLAAIDSNMFTTTPTLQIPYWTFLSVALVSFALATVECLILFYKLHANAALYIRFPDEQPIEETFVL